ncbi:MAG TPA: hypothetical protein DCS93_30585 [Microscillaceae bacterium]|nr:hypothetical protein [Microscillaceae bacterium]
MLQQYHTSLRTRPIAETLIFAKAYAQKLGISRVTNTTRLDRIGIPVYASIRPDAMSGSLCVNAGKGLTEQEAQVGAYMEAIEMALAEPNRANLPIIKAKISEVLDSSTRPQAILDLCPKRNAQIDPAATLDCVEAWEINQGNSFKIPAELVFTPYPNKSPWFSSNTNGLSSGNSLTEATIHGLLEVIERDISSFHSIRDTSQLVTAESYPPKIAAIAQQVHQAGLELVVRYANNELGIPYFMAAVVDHELANPVFIHGGYGCHTLKEIAMMRAVTEAIQSRLSFIHGGRDDLTDAFKITPDQTIEDRTQKFHQLVAGFKNDQRIIHFADIPAYDWPFATLEEYLAQLLHLLQDYDFHQVLRVAFTKSDEPLQVVKIIVPKMEFFSRKTPRIGVRLSHHLHTIAHNS